MPGYFNKFPKIKYGDVVLKDITRRAKFLENISNDPLVYLPYTVEHDDRPEDVAYYYYGDPDFVWLIYMANTIIDPYTDWVKTGSDFENFLISEYAEISGATGYDVIAWTQNTGIDNNIVHYENREDSSIIVSPDTILASDDNTEVSRWRAIRVYDYEYQKNEDRRNISVINRVYADQMDKELEALLNG